MSESKTQETQSQKDLTQKGPGIADPAAAEPVEPVVKNLALSSPRSDGDVATSVAGAQNTHTPPSLDEFDEYGRVRD